MTIWRESVCALCAITALCVAESYADIIVTATHSDYEVVRGDLGDVRLSVGMTVSNRKAIFIFKNVSTAPETSVVFKTIMLDTYDDDSHQTILWNGKVLTNTSNVSYKLGSYNSLPGYNDILKNDDGLIELTAKSPPTKKGISPGETLQVQFNTTLPDGSDILDYLSAFGGGCDTAAYSIGFHGISSTIINYESLSGVYVPEPATVALICLGGALIFIRRRRTAVE